ERDFVVEFGRDFGRVERDLEFRAFVFLDIKSGLSVFAARDADAVGPGQPVAWRDKTAAERTVVIAAMLGPGHLLAVGIGENNFERAAGQHVVIVLVRIDPQSDSLILDGLAGAIEGAVGEEDGVVVGSGFVPSIGILFLLAAQGAALVPHLQKGAARFR